MEISFLSVLLYLAICLCLGSAMTAYTCRTPKYEEYIWRKEAHQFLALPFNEAAPPSFSQGRSHCPHCHHTLNALDLIPLISFVLSFGKCRYCHHKISIRYPLIEAITLLLCFPLLFLIEQWVPLLIITCIFSLLISISIIDWQHQWIPDQLNLLVLGFSLAFHLLDRQLGQESALLGMMLGYLCIVTLRQIYLTLKGIEAIGLGDAKLLAALGAWQGFENLFYILFYASILGVIYAIISKKGRYQSVAFGPFLCIAALVNYFITLTY